jgi:large repetitive protein
LNNKLHALFLLIAGSTPAVAQFAITTPTPLPTGVLNIPYSITLATTGTTAFVGWDIAGGTLPVGLRLDEETGEITGTPVQQSGTFTFDVIANTFSEGPSASNTKRFTLKINQRIAVSTASFQGQVGVPFNQALSATGGENNGPYTWTIVTGSLPAGLTLNSATGAITGTPAGPPTTSAFGVTATDTASPTQTSPPAQVVIVISPAPLLLATASPLPTGIRTAPYSLTFTATGGVLPYAWDLTAGSVPTGLTFTSAGVLTGTPTQSGTFSFTARVRDYTMQPATRAFVLQIVEPLQIVTPSLLTAATQSEPYNQTLLASGGATPYTWSLAGGSLPPGLTLTPAGVITGTPTVVGQAAFIARVRDAINQTVTREFTLSVATRRIPLEFVTTSLAEGTVGVLYGATVSARGGTLPYTFAITGLPPGIESDAQGRISGIPTRSGQFAVSVSVTDVAQGQVSATLTITIRGVPVEVTTVSVPEGSSNTPYNTTFAARGGVPPYTWSVASGSLPPGLSVSVSGQLSGTPAQQGTFTFTVQATDTERQSGSKAFTLLIRAASLTITTATLPSGAIDSAYASSLAATGGRSPYKWSLSGSVPPGLVLNGETGAISGTPTAAGSFTFAAQVADADGQNATRNFTVTISPALVITTTSPLPPITVSTAGTVRFSATGGTPPYTWATGGAIPAGMTFSAGQLSGTPAATGTFSFNVQVTDANSLSTSKAFTLAVVSSLMITTEALPGGTVGTRYSANVSAAGGVPPYRWSATGSVPPGVSVDEAGAMTGTPTVAGTFNFNVQVRDAAQPEGTSTRAYTIVVAAPQLTSVNITGLPDNPAPGQQPRLNLSIGSSLPLEVTGTLTLTFASDAANNADDPVIQFSTGGRTATFTIPAGQTQAVFRAPELMIQTGTVAGTITITTAFAASGAPVTCTCPLVRTLIVPRTAPVINSVRVSRTANGFNLVITGFSATREVTRGVFRFSGTMALQTNEIIIPLTDVFNTYFRGNSQVGGQFVLTMPFVIQGEAGAVTSVSLLLSNAQGDSASSPASL